MTKFSTGDVKNADAWRDDWLRDHPGKTLADYEIAGSCSDTDEGYAEFQKWVYERSEWERGVGKTFDKAKRDHDRDSGVYEAELARLALLPDLEYQIERVSAAARIGENGIPLVALDRMVKARRPKRAAKKSAAPEFDLDELQRSASAIIKHSDILSLFAKEFSKVVAGETVNGKLLYLVATSRLFDKPMNAAIKGTSAGGKSEIRKRILGYFPPEDVVAFTSLSEKSLIYHDGDFSHKILSMGEATATDEQNFQDYLLRELMSEGYIRHSTVQKVGNDLETMTIEKQGPVAFLVTTTKSKMHPENETRMLSLEIDDSESQTKKVLDKVAQVHGLRDIAPVDYKPWQDFQRWLAAGERRVVVPFAAVMVELIPPVAVRLRRDVGQVICAIKAHALLHRDQRDRDEAGQIVADIDRDYEAVRKLMNAIIAEGSGAAINPAITETIDAVVKATISMTEAGGANAKDIAKLLKLDRSAAWRRLSAACDEGYIVNLEQRQRMPGKYRASGQKVEPVNILPAAVKLAEKYSSHTPLKSAHSCNRDGIADISLGDNECKDECTPSAECVEPSARVHTSANGLALVNHLDRKGNSPPVARLHANSGGTAAKVCAQCGGDGADLEVAYGDASALVHRECQDSWRAAQDLTIPAALRQCPDDEVWDRLAGEGNGFAISGCGQNPEDRRSPAISSGPDDDLDDFKIS
jgi:hypothetical protein